MTLGDLMALESRWSVVVVLIALGVIELLGIRGTKTSRARRVAARKAFEEHMAVPRRSVARSVGSRSTAQSVGLAARRGENR